MRHLDLVVLDFPTIKGSDCFDLFNGRVIWSGNICIGMTLRILKRLSQVFCFPLRQFVGFTKIEPTTFVMLALTECAMLAWIGVIVQVGLAYGSYHYLNPHDAFCVVEYKGSIKVPRDVELAWKRVWHRWWAKILWNQWSWTHWWLELRRMWVCNPLRTIIVETVVLPSLVGIELVTQIWIVGHPICPYHIRIFHDCVCKK